MRDASFSAPFGLFLLKKGAVVALRLVVGACWMDLAAVGSPRTLLVMLRGLSTYCPYYRLQAEGECPRPEGSGASYVLPVLPPSGLGHARGLKAPGLAL